jgi:type II secretory pathway predicted ATPase ExeA
MVWYQRYGWENNPFELKPKPDYISGFEDIRSEILEFIKSGSCCLLIGEAGMGKTTILKWLEKYALEEGIPVYINTAGMKHEEIEHLNIDKLIREKTGILGKMLQKDKKVILLVDEAQTLPLMMGEAIKRNFEEQRVKSVVLASPTYELDNLKTSLLGLIGRRRIKLRPMNQEEAMNMIIKRTGFKNPFTPDSLETIFKKAKFLPKNILEACELLAKKNTEPTITKYFVEMYFAEEETKPDKSEFLAKLSPLQRKIVNILMEKNSRPIEIATKLAKPTKTITGQLAYLGLKSRVGVMMRKGIEQPVVEKASEKPAVYKLTEDIKKMLFEK